jgi:hypothetical protein
MHVTEQPEDQYENQNSGDAATAKLPGGCTREKSA